MYERPKIGTKMYFVKEHLYYIPNHTGPIKEFCVCEAVVKGFHTLGYTELCLSSTDPDGFCTPYWFRVNEIGKRVFYTAEEAARLAKTITQKYESVWGWIGKPHIPMRRTWKNYLI